ncbi:LysR family transcriptional regulator [Achromobacter aloeverae]|uniref:LysR family transcriptional regulator n=1 Tax=Achromobacter aloeverae TaxID=1750518 RepID=A0A4Q1HSP3_9BURK|nr:LysR family transcriptional regulator [Achromobacter aloeverae]RXN93316.1 LysR family transcriptional regulator [Achromobacter aloeverae]
MNLRLFGIFRAVMNAQSTIGAARHLNISQPTVSNAIRQLEDELGFELFDRMGNRLVAREEARMLFKESESMFLFADRLAGVAEDLKENRAGRVRVVATPQLGHTILPAAIARFVAARPKVKVVCDVVDSHHVIESTEAMAADFGMAVALEPALSGNLEMVLMDEAEVVCVLPAGHPLAERKSLSPKDISPFPFIALENSARLSAPIRTAFDSAGARYAPSIEVRYSETACLLAKAGAGVTLVDSYSAATLAQARAVKVVPFRPRIPVNVWAIFPKDRPRSRLTRALIEEIKAGMAGSGKAKGR